MFRDDKTQGEQQAEVVQYPSREGFLAFCETKDPSEEYTYVDIGYCACAQYADSIGLRQEWLDAPLFDERFQHRHHGIWSRLDVLAQDVQLRTFGVLVERLRAAA